MGLKIALVAPYKVRCGIYSYSRDLVDALANRDVDVYWIRLPRFGAKTNDIMRNIAESIPIKEIDLIHVQHEYGLYHQLENEFYSTLHNFGKPIVTTMHAIGNFKIDPIIDHYSDLAITHNEFCNRQFQFPSKIIHHGCKICETVPMEEAKSSLGVDPRIPVVGYVGYISEYKGIETLIKAMTEIENVGLLIGGGWHFGLNTAYINGLKSHSFEALPSRCQWTGFIPEDRLATVYGGLDFVVYPSVHATESGALLMALGHGKAVIARNLPPFKEKEEDGALITFKDVSDLRKKICKLLRDDIVRELLEAGAREYAMENNWDNIAKIHIETYEEVLEKHA